MKKLLLITIGLITLLAFTKNVVFAEDEYSNDIYGNYGHRYNCHENFNNHRQHHCH